LWFKVQQSASFSVKVLLLVHLSKFQIANFSYEEFKAILPPRFKLDFGFRHVRHAHHVGDILFLRDLHH